MNRIVKILTCAVTLLCIISSHVLAMDKGFKVVKLSVPQQVSDTVDFSSNTICTQENVINLITSKGYGIIDPDYIRKKCKEAKNGVVVIPDGIYCTFADAFLDFTAKELIIEGYIDEISSGMFAGTSVESIIIKKGPIKICDGAFQNCPKLRSVKLPSSYIDGKSSTRCEEMIPDRTFYNCPKLETVTLSPNTKRLGKEAFKNCVSLRMLENVSEITYMGKGLFDNCGITSNNSLLFNSDRFKEKLREALSQKSELIKSSNRAFMDYLNDLRGPEIRIKTMTDIYEIPKGAFKGRTDIESVIIEDGFTKIGEGAFEGCTNLKRVILPGNYKKNYIKDINVYKMFSIYHGLIRIGDSAFKNCPNLLDINFVDSIDYIGPEAFNGCKMLRSGDLSRTNIREIKESTFKGCESLVYINLPEKVSVIDEEAFSKCKGIVALDLSNTMLTRLEKNAFSDCEGLLCVGLPGVIDSIGDGAFLGCKNISVFRAPSVNHIGSMAFADSSYIKNVVFSNDTKFEQDSFAPTTNVWTNSRCVDNLIICGDRLMKYIGKNKKILLPEGIKYIDSNAFDNVKTIEIESGSMEDLANISSDKVIYRNFVMTGSGKEKISLSKELNGRVKNLKLQNYIVEIDDTSDNMKEIESITIIDGNLETIENLRSDSLVKLEIINCGLKRLGNISKNLPNLRFVDFSNNKLTDVSELAKMKMERLDIGNNYLEEIPEYIRNLTPNSYKQNIWTLNNIAKGPLREEVRRQLKENGWNTGKIEKIKLENVSIGDLRGIGLLSGLKELKLKNCDVTEKTVGFAELTKLKNLEILDISYNKISNALFLFELKNLKVIRLQHNNIMSMPNLKNLKKLEELNLKGNVLLGSVNFLNGCESLKKVDISNIGVKDISSLANCNKLCSVNMRENLIEDLSVLSDKYRLRKINAANNRIKNVNFLDKISGGLECIDISGNYITYIPEFLRNKNKKYIRQVDRIYSLNENFRDENLAKAILEILEQKNLPDYKEETVKQALLGIRQLDLSGKNIKDISGINEFKNLEALNLSDNEIENIDAIKLANLMVLNLSNNKIASLVDLENRFGILGLLELRELNLSNNQIKNIKALEPLEKLEILDISYNKIKNIDALKQKLNLRILNAGHNKISLLDELFARDEFGNSKEINLEEVDFSSNRIESIPELNCPSLVSINLSDNQITDIEGLKNAKNLVTLDISNNNKIEDGKVLNSLNRMKMLNISYTGISLSNINKNSLEEIWCIGNKGSSIKNSQLGRDVKIRLNGYGYAVDNNLKSLKIVNNIYLSMEAFKVARGLNGALKDDYEQALIQLATDAKLQGRNEHILSGIRSGFTAIDLKDGTAKGRGKNRLIYKKSNNNIIVYEVSCNHYN